MKAGIVNGLWHHRYAALLIVMIVLITAALYSVFTKAELPECRAVVRISNHGEGSELERVLKLSMVPSGWRQVTVLLNGSFIDGQNKYVVDRVLVMSYRREGQHFNFLVKESIKKPSDSLTRKDLELRLPATGLQYHFLIEKMDERHFLFSSNHSPLFVCTTPS